MREHMSHQERRELWRERAAAFYDSGLSAAQFCAEHELKQHYSGTGPSVSARKLCRGSTHVCLGALTQEVPSSRPSPFAWVCGSMKILFDSIGDLGDRENPKRVIELFRNW